MYKTGFNKAALQSSALKNQERTFIMYLVEKFFTLIYIIMDYNVWLIKVAQLKLTERGPFDVSAWFLQEKTS